MTSEVTQAALESCPNPWCNSRKTVDCEIRAAEAPILMPSRSSAEWAVACPVCPLQTPYFDTEAEAIAAWNTRLTAHSGEGRSGAGEDVKRDCYATAVRDLAKMGHVPEALKGVLFDCADLLDAKDEEIARLSCKGGREGAIGDIATERQRQIEAEGWTPEHDDKHYGGELSRAAACYAAHASAFQRVTVDLTAYRTADPARHDYGWPWSSSWWKPSTPRRDLVKAGALIVAEIERLDRAALRATDDAGGA